MDAQETVAALVEDVPGFLPPPCKRSLQEELQICGIQVGRLLVIVRMAIAKSKAHGNNVLICLPSAPSH